MGCFCKCVTCFSRVLLSPVSVQKDVRSDPKVVQDVSLATDTLLQSLGSLAVEVSLSKNIPHLLDAKSDIR